MMPPFERVVNAPTRHRLAGRGAQTSRDRQQLITLWRRAVVLRKKPRPGVRPRALQHFMDDRIRRETADMRCCMMRRLTG